MKIDRRLFMTNVIGGLAVASGIPSRAHADEFTPEIVPNEQGFADFAGVWQTDPGIQVVADAPDLPQGVAEQYGAVVLKSASYADAIFQNFGKKRPFIQWFNDECAGKGYWAKRKISGSQADYESFWNQFLSGKQLSLMQFLAYMSVFANEVEGKLKNRSEAFGNKDHPGISYLFDRVTLSDPVSGRTWTKASYNTGKQNVSAYNLFRTASFNSAHGKKAAAEQLLNTNNGKWAGDNYSLLGFPYKADEQQVGYILEADFFKFRGRGLIQTTWRDNYRKLVRYIRANPDASKVFTKFSLAWAGTSDEEVLNTSSTRDWDELFGDPSKELLCAAIRLHEEDAHYANLAKSSAINGKGGGSLALMGDSVGGRGYGQRLKGRVRQMCVSLGEVKQ